MIAVTLTRASGLVNNHTVDATWEVFWQYMSAQVGLILSTATAFRTFFVARSRRSPEVTNHAAWYRTLLLQLTPMLNSTRRIHRRNLKSPSSPDTTKDLSERTQEMMALPQIPPPTMTGIRTYITGVGKRTWTPSQIMASRKGQSTRQSQIMLSRTFEVDVEHSAAGPDH